jgi:citrate lyase subunit beta / citryl-CoA lyase
VHYRMQQCGLRARHDLSNASYRNPSMENSLRSLLFVPGDQAGKIEKAWGTGPDCVILDLEDSVAQSHKAVARKNIRDALAAAPAQTPVVLVRINPSPSQRAEDIEAVVHPGVFGIVLPKCNSRKQVVEAAHALGQVERRRGMADRSLKLFLLIESAHGLLELPSIVRGSDRVTAVIFGAEDWCLDMGIVRTKAGDEIEIARWNIVLCARARGLAAMDTIYADVHDTEGLLRDTETARRMGFSGKLAIHPKQIAVIHAAFAPSPAEIAEAETVVAAFEEAEANGRGAVAVNGKMVDKPVAEQARQTLLRARKTR